MSGKTSQTLVIPDCHIPYHDRHAYELMLWVAKQSKVNRIVILGDYADFYAVSSHERGANAERHLKREVMAVNGELDRLDELFPKVEKIFIQGNHEWRLERYLDARAPELFGLVDTPSLLKLEKRGWEYHPYTPDQLARIGQSKLYARHTPLGGGVMPCHQTVLKAGCSVIYGHVHTAQSSQVVMANGDTHIAMSVGWLGDKKQDAFNYVAGHHQWSLGFGLVTMDDKDGFFWADTIRIFRTGNTYRCVANGAIFEYKVA